MKKILLIILLVTLGFLTRLLPHPPNFTAIGAIALFGGMYLPKKYAIIVPIAAMLLSDLFVGFYSGKLMLAVYLSFVIMVLVGGLMKEQKNIPRTIAGTLLGSLCFFAITNAAVWALGTGYPPTFSGLMSSYMMAIPFFKNSLVANFVYLTGLVGAMEFVIQKNFSWAPRIHAIQT